MLWKRQDLREQTEYSFQGALHVAMGMLGWLLPNTESAVKAASLEDTALQGELPDELRDPLAVFERDRRTLIPEPESRGGCD